MTSEMQVSRSCPRHTWAELGGLMLLALLLSLLGGCEVDSFFDPSVQGRWEKTPVVLPILEQLDIIDEPQAKVVGFSQVMPEDLEADISEYVIGPGDTIAISIFELINPGQDFEQYKKVDDLGMIRFPMIGPLRVGGKTTSQLEREIADIALKKNLIKQPTVSVSVADARQRTYSVVGESSTVVGTGIGTYVIPHQDFRVLEAIALAHGIPGTVKRIYVIRQVQLVPTGASTQPEVKPAQSESAATPEDLIDILNKGLESDASQPAPPATQSEQLPPPSNLSGTLDSNEASKWVSVNGKWVKLETPTTAPTTTTASTTQPATSVQRVIEIPYAELLEGNMQYNVVIRPGDIIRIPAPVSGNIYLGGQIARPGTYGLPGEKDLNLKQAIFAAGGITSLADPHRVDLIRRIGNDREATVRLDLKAIFDGTAPDFFLKPNDTVNFGSNFFMTPLAVMRNGFRASYGFGFILDRNFEQEVFGSLSSGR